MWTHKFHRGTDEFQWSCSLDLRSVTLFLTASFSNLECFHYFHTHSFLFRDCTYRILWICTFHNFSGSNRLVDVGFHKLCQTQYVNVPKTFLQNCNSPTWYIQYLQMFSVIQIIVERAQISQICSNSLPKSENSESKQINKLIPIWLSNFVKF